MNNCPCFIAEVIGTSLLLGTIKMVQQQNKMEKERKDKKARSSIRESNDGNVI